ncbi:FRG domain-containing protein [Candidatus Bipolaricaulota bacterium]|nr:FRG domain-containing protein [Candidatus Bipolaricaulota bacterium]
MTSSDFWQPYEETISSYDELASVIDEVFTKWSARSRVFAWRGLVNADWPLHSSLYRRVLWTHTKSLPEEADIRRHEKSILADVHRWGLHVSPTGARMSILNQLATLQHYGAPTRLIDVTFNPWIGAWFAVEQKWNNGDELHAASDARLFAIDVTRRLINENDSYRDWEDEPHTPWPHRPPKNASDDEKRTWREWCSKVFAWHPPHYDNRIAAQNGGFIFGGVPMTNGLTGQNQWPKGGDTPGFWKIAEVRSATSVALRPHKLETTHGGVSQNAVYSFRITHSAKTEIRERLERNFNYKHSTVYPDYTGFAEFATHNLKTRKPRP